MPNQVPGARGFADLAGLLRGPQHGHVVGHRDDTERQEEREQPRGEEHHLYRLRNHHHRDDVDLFGERQRRAHRLVTRRGRERRTFEELGRIRLVGAIVAQRPYLVADGGHHEDDCHDGEESDGLPQPLAGHPGRQLPQFAGEINDHGEHQQGQRTAHQRAECPELYPCESERPQDN